MAALRVVLTQLADPVVLIRGNPSQQMLIGTSCRTAAGPSERRRGNQQVM